MLILEFGRVLHHEHLGGFAFLNTIEYKFRPHNKTYTSPPISKHIELIIFVLNLSHLWYIGAYTAKNKINIGVCFIKPYLYFL